MSSVIGQLAAQYPNVTFLKVNTDMFPEISSSIRSIPTIVFYKNGQQVHRQSGALTVQQMGALIQKLF
jgi:thioredoxin-like negative regulator of GroEL